MGTLYYWDKTTRTFTTTPPAPMFPKYGQAPMYISDYMPPIKHQMTGELIDSRSKWRDINKATGLVDCKEIPKKPTFEEQVGPDIDKALDVAIEKVRAGATHYTEDQKAKFKARDEAIKAKLGTDPAEALIGKKGKDGRYKPR